MELNS
jgi:hypothetical protein